MKKHPLIIETLHEVEGGPLLGYYSKGHHAAEDFLSALEAGWEVTLQPEDVHQCYWRAVKAFECEGQQIITARGPARGAFPVTYAEVHP